MIGAGLVAMADGTYQPIAEQMTKRDQFAMAAMQAFIGTALPTSLGGLDGYEMQTAVAAYRMADAMLAESGRTEP